MKRNDWSKHNPMRNPGAAKKNSLNSPWRKQAFCKTENAAKSRKRLNDNPK